VSEPSKPGVLVGLVRPREHCTFAWEEPESGGRRTAWVRGTHCAQCIDELRALGYMLVGEDAPLRAGG
jgi:hypothetical protein